MAIFIDGMKCPLCTKPIYKNQEVILFPSFVANKLDPIWMFNDSVFHLECFKEHPLSIEAKRRLEEFTIKTNPKYRLCVICKNKFTNPDDYLGVGHLTNNANDPLYNYNYLQLHKSCLSKWSKLEEFITLLKQLKDSNEWESMGLEYLLSELMDKVNKS